jgi:hypothetical protein
VELDAIELRAREETALVQDRVRDSGRAEFMQQGGPSKRRDLGIGETEQPGGVNGELCASSAVAGHVRRFQVDEVGRHHEGCVEFGALQGAVRFRLEVEHFVPRLHLVQLVEPGAPVIGEQVGQLRVVGAVATLVRGLDRPRR